MKLKAYESIILTFEPEGIKSEFKKGMKILDALRKVGLNIRSECGGREVCGKCRIIIKDPSKVGQVTEAERERLSRSELKSGHRLACACSVVGDAVVYIPEESRQVARKLLIEGTERPVTVEPAIRKVFIRIPKPSLQDFRSDVQRLQDALREIYGIKAVDIDHQLLRKLPTVLRDSNWRVTVTIWDEREIISVDKGDTSEEAYGIAVDIGTSKIIAYLSNLINGELVATESMENPQIMHGEDIISRISYSSKSDASLHELQKLAVNCLNTLISQACKKSALTPQSVYEMTLVGNTAMHHIFLGISPKHLGLSPYVPAVSHSINEKARNLRLKVNCHANVYVFPLIAGFVGGDAVADIISTRIYESKALSMVLDIGTNTEVIIGDKHGLMACSCASGPAFEGAHIRCGMKAVVGAIEKLDIAPKSYEVHYQTIGDAKPVGLCGSAIIDAVANLLKCRVIDKNGKFNDSSLSPRLRKINGEEVFVLVSKKEGARRDIVVSQKDVQEVQLAKAAIYTGCHILMKRKGIRPSAIKKLYLAGAFGNYINPLNAKLIGMLPDIPTESINFVGNAAGIGARMALVSKKLRDVATSISRKTDYMELAAEPDFQTEFASAMYFPHRDLNRFQSIKNMF